MLKNVLFSGQWILIYSLINRSKFTLVQKSVTFNPGGMLIELVTYK